MMRFRNPFSRPMCSIRRLTALTTHRARVDMARPVPAVTFAAMGRISRYFKTTLCGVENLPSDRSLLVGNHALGGVDSIALFPELYRQSGRVPRGLALRALFEIPFVCSLLDECGVVRGDRQTAVDLLSRDELVVVYPGGTRDSFKGPDQKYLLSWGARCGFAHVAMQAAAPVVPVAGIGPDDVFPVLSGNGLKLGFLNSEPLPIFLPLARRVPFTFYFGVPLHPPPVTGDSATDQIAAAEFVLEVRVALETLIAEGLQARLSP